MRLRSGDQHRDLSCGPPGRRHRLGAHHDLADGRRVDWGGTLNTIATTGAANYVASQAARSDLAAALVHGFSLAAAWGAGILVVGAVTAAVLVNAGVPESRTAEAMAREAAGHQAI